MYKVIFIDEFKEDIDAFLDYIDEKDKEKKFEVEYVFPLPDLSEMIDVVLAKRVDAIVIDFKLNDYKDDIQYNVPYDGVQLREEILRVRENFPCFILTSFDGDAIQYSYDVNPIYPKKVLHNLEEKGKPEKVNEQDSEGEPRTNATFISRLEQQIIHYRKRMTDAEQELDHLIEKSNDTELTASEEERLVKLDEFLETALHRPSKIPSNIKNKDFLNEIHNLISDTDKFLTELKAKKDD